MPWVIEFHVRTEAVTSFHVIVTGQARRRQQMLTWAPEPEIECSAVSCLWPGLVSSHGSAPGLTRAPHSRSSKTIASRQESRHDQTRSRPHTRSATTNGIPVSNSVKIIVDFLENLTYSESLRLRMQMNVRRNDSHDRSTLRLLSPVTRKDKNVHWILDYSSCSRRIKYLTPVKWDSGILPTPGFWWIIAQLQNARDN